MGLGLDTTSKAKQKMGQLWAKMKANCGMKWAWVLNNTTKAKNGQRKDQKMATLPFFFYKEDPIRRLH
jgi:hypothetical protein